MDAKFLIYVLVTILVVWSLDAVNINAIFKKNRVLQARVFYTLMALSIIYLITNFIYDFFIAVKFV